MENPNPIKPITIKLRKQQIDILKLAAKKNFMTLSGFIRKTMIQSLIKSGEIKQKDLEKLIDW